MSKIIISDGCFLLLSFLCTCAASYFSTRNMGFNGWMPLLGFPLYVLIVLVSIKKIKSIDVQSSVSLLSPPPRGFEPISKRVNKKDLLLLLRFFAAFLVFVMHSRIVFNINSANISGSHSWINLSPAWLGMNIFFTLSGYLMGKFFILEGTDCLASEYQNIIRVDSYVYFQLQFF